MMDKNLAIQASGLTRRFGKNLAVDNVDLAIKHGEIYGFLGPNGAGKSTTIRMLVTLLAPTSGEAWIMGKNIDHNTTDVRLQIGVALQEAALDPQQTGEELLRLQGRLYGLSPKEVNERVKDLKGLVDIGEAFSQRIKTYSGGMKRRLDLAAALIHNPKVLFLDEPTTGLDPVSRTAVWNEVRRLNRDLGMTIFLTTQYMEEADHLAERVGIISEGRIVAEGSPKDLKRSVGEDVVIIKTKNNTKDVVSILNSINEVDKVDVQDQEISIATAHGESVVGPIAVALDKAGIQVEQLSLRSPSLDDVFLEVTGNRMAQTEQEQIEAKEQSI